MQKQLYCQCNQKTKDKKQIFTKSQMILIRYLLCQNSVSAPKKNFLPIYSFVVSESDNLNICVIIMQKIGVILTSAEEVLTIIIIIITTNKALVKQRKTKKTVNR